MSGLVQHYGLFALFAIVMLESGGVPIPGETFVFTQFAGEPQCFLTEAQLVAELGRVGFAPDPGVPFREYNRPPPGTLSGGRMPVIYEAAFRKT